MIMRTTPFVRFRRRHHRLQGCRAFGSEPNAWAFPQTAFEETLGFCAILVGPLLENSNMDTTFFATVAKDRKRVVPNSLLEKEFGSP